MATPISVFALSTPVTHVAGVFFYVPVVVMDSVTWAGIDLGTHSFRLRGQNRKVLPAFFRKQLTGFLAKLHPCLAAMQACAGTHCYLACKLTGHRV